MFTSKTCRTRFGNTKTDESRDSCDTGRLICSKQATRGDPAGAPQQQPPARQTLEHQCQSRAAHSWGSTCGTLAEEEISEEPTRQPATWQEPVPDQRPTQQTEIVAGKPAGSASAGPEAQGQQHAPSGHGRPGSEDGVEPRSTWEHQMRLRQPT